jgi:HEAT repeat protein
MKAVCKRFNMLLMAWLVIGSAPTLAQIRVNTLERGAQGMPSVAVDGKGGFVVVWQFHEEGTRDLDCLRGRVFAPDGSVRTGELRIDNLPGDYARNPAVDISASGDRFVVVWEGGSEGDRTRRTIWARVLRGNGEPISKEIYVNDKRLYAFELGIPTRFHGRPGVSLAEDGSFVVVWRAFGGTTCSRFKIVARRFGPSGQPLGKEFLVDEDGRGAQLAPAVGHAGNGSFVVSWTAGWRYGLADQRLALRVRQFDPKGKPLAAATQLGEELVGGNLPPVLSVAADGSIAVAWYSGDLFTETTQKGTIKLQLATPDGRPSGGVSTVAGAVKAPATAYSPAPGQRGRRPRRRGGRSMPVASTASRAEQAGSIGERVLAYPPAIAHVPKHGILVTWVSSQPAPAGSIVVGRLVPSDGSPGGDPFVISQPTCRNASRQGLSVGANGTAVAVWEYSWTEAINALRFSATDPEKVLVTESPGPGLSARLEEAVAILDDGHVRADRQTAANTLTCLMKTANSALPTATRCLHSQTESSVRALCATAVASIAADQGQAADAFVHSLQNEESTKVRSRVVLGLGQLESVATRTLPILVDALDDPSAEIRAAAVASLARLQARSTIASLRKVYERDPELGLRIDAAALLYQLERNKEALQSLVYWAENAEHALYRSRALLRLTGLDYPPHDTLIDALGGNVERAGGWLEQHEMVWNGQPRQSRMPHVASERSIRLRALQALGRNEQAIGQEDARVIFSYTLTSDRELRQAAIDALLPKFSDDRKIHSTVSNILYHGLIADSGDAGDIAMVVDFLYRCGSAGLQRHEARLRRLIEKADFDSVEGALETIDEEDLCFGDSVTGPVIAVPANVDP